MPAAPREGGREGSEHVKKRAGEAGKRMYLECGEIYGFLTNVIAVEGRDEVVDGDAHGGSERGVRCVDGQGRRGDGGEERARVGKRKRNSVMKLLGLSSI